jgi:hypothetical protein
MRQGGTKQSVLILPIEELAHLLKENSWRLWVQCWTEATIATDVSDVPNLTRSVK